MRIDLCPHNNSEHVKLLEAKRLEKKVSCCSCAFSGPNLWLCLHPSCSFVGCSEQVKDHSTVHFKNYNLHCIHVNMTSRRAWCYICEREVPVRTTLSTQNQDTFSNLVGMFVAKDVESEEKFIHPEMGIVGLQNIANTCYMNSALQALSNLMPMTHYFLNCSEIIEHKIGESVHKSKVAGLAKSYQRLMRDLWENAEQKVYVAPRGILYGIRSVHPMFRGFQQHDTQEFLRCFMDQLHEELKEVTVFNDLDTKKNKDHESILNSDCSTDSCTSNLSDSEYETCGSSLSDDSIQIASKRSSTGEIKKNKLKNELSSQSHQSIKYSSIISQIFDGKLLSSVQCLTCDRVSTREETFQDLSLPIPNRDYLNVLHQSHSPSMSSLNSIDIATQRSSEGWLNWMWSFLRSWIWGPSVTLYDCMASFFSADELKGDNMYSCEKCNKLRTGIKYSRILDLPEVLCIHLKRFRHDLSFSSKISSHVMFPLEGLDMRPYLDKNCKSKISLYRLASVICHHGTVGGGHYTCFARNCLTNRWYEYDDQHVTEVTSDVVENCQAYVLFYQKENPHMDIIRTKATEISLLNPVHTADIRFFLSKEWLSRFSTFSEPGPINNSAILCPHGGILNSKSTLIGQIAIPISQPVWDYLYRKVGGGPAINMIYECEICKRAAEALARRQYYELAVFTKYNVNDADQESGAIYAISMQWLRKWQQFARGISSKEPGPISNTSIVPCDASQNFSPIRNVRQGSDYAQINGPLWSFLLSVYGGGPEIIVRESLNDEIEIIDQDELNDNDDHSFNNISDTESNIGHNPSVQEVSGQTNTLVDTDSEIAIGMLTQQMQPMVKDFKNKNATSHLKLCKTNALHQNFRKKNKRGKLHFKNAEFFGPKGNYKPKLQSSTVETTKENHSTDDVSNDPGDLKIYHRKPFRRNKKRHLPHMDKNDIAESRQKADRKEDIGLKKYSLLQNTTVSHETDA